ncbi:MAG: glycerol-3-phosphate acyltransferase [Ignavibacteria bacterium]|nr:glycerol-3-phosphate acyltransferase [Ignavibacteria bacterium]
MYQFLWLALFSYVLGSIPFAYIFVKIFARKNVIEEGSGNVGAMNSYEVTRNRWIGLAVFVFDFAKGLVPILAANKFFPQNDFAILVASACAVLGHNYSIFLLFKGGKGLATTSGILFLIQPILLLFWAIVWFLFYNFIRKDMDYANPFATILTPFFFFLIPEWFAKLSAFVPLHSKIMLFIIVGILAIIIVSKYLFLFLPRILKK